MLLVRSCFWCPIIQWPVRVKQGTPPACRKARCKGGLTQTMCSVCRETGLHLQIKLVNLTSWIMLLLWETRTQGLGSRSQHNNIDFIWICLYYSRQMDSCSQTVRMSFSWQKLQTSRKTVRKTASEPTGLQQSFFFSRFLLKQKILASSHRVLNYKLYKSTPIGIQWFFSWLKVCLYSLYTSDSHCGALAFCFSAHHFRFHLNQIQSTRVFLLLGLKQSQEKAWFTLD